MTLLHKYFTSIICNDHLITYVTAAGLRASNSRNTSIWPEWIWLGMCRVVTATRSVTVMEYYFYFGQAHALATPKGGGPCPLGTLYYLVVGHLDSRLR